MTVASQADSAAQLRAPRRLRFTLRTLLFLTLVVAMALGWHASLRNVKERLARETMKLQYAEQELRRARDEAKDRERPTRLAARNFWQAKLNGAHLAGVTISSPTNAFQRASLKNCNLENATLEAGNAAFQIAHFDGSNLAGAKLTGGGASFQGATFVGCNLTGAILSGGGCSFQGSSFENAMLVDAKVIGSLASFQAVNISGARFEGADLSALESQSLGSCYFNEPPIYDSRTRFPTGFDPAARLWRRVSE